MGERAKVLEADFKALLSQDGVRGMVVLDGNGVAIREMIAPGQAPEFTAVNLAYQLSTLVSKSAAIIADLDPANELQMLRVRSEKYEIIAALHGDYTLAVIHDDNDAQEERERVTELAIDAMEPK